MSSFFVIILSLSAPLLGVALLWLTHVLYVRRPQRLDSAAPLALRFAGWFLIIGGLLAPLIGSFIGVGLLVAAVPIISMAFAQFGAQERRSLLWMLAVAAQRRLPLATTARSFAAERTDGVGRGAARLAKLLDQGVALPDALKESGNRLPMDVEITTRLEHESGGLGAGLVDVSRDAAQRERMWRPMFQKSMYFVMLFVATYGIFTFLTLRIVPAFQQIFEDFDTELPAITQLVVASADFLARYWFILVPIVGAAFVALLLCAQYYDGSWRNAPRFLQWITRPFHRATLLQVLANTVEQGRPLPQTLDLLARWYPEPAIKNRLLTVCGQVDGGRDWSEAMLEAKLLRSSDASVLRAAQRVGNLPWAMREMARRNFRRIESLAGVMNNIVFPLVLLAYALPIGMVVLAIFIPLVSLIYNLS